MGMPRNPVVEALSDIARALRPPGDERGPIAWSVELLPGQVEREVLCLRDRIHALGVEKEKLRAFAAELFAEWPEECGIDAFDLQDLAVKHGLLKGKRVYEPCQEEGCFCAAYYDWVDGWGERGVTCYRRTKLLTGEGE